MRKLFLIPVLALLGCASVPKPQAVVAHDPPVVVIARGTNVNTNWRCDVEELNPALVWVECDFQNNQAVAVESICIKADFYNEQTDRLVAESNNQVCSGVLLAHGSHTGFVAFTDTNRKALQVCGSDLSSCVMLAGPRSEYKSINKQ